MDWKSNLIRSAALAVFALIAAFGGTDDPPARDDASGQAEVAELNMATAGGEGGADTDATATAEESPAAWWVDLDVELG